MFLGLRHMCESLAFMCEFQIRCRVRLTQDRWKNDNGLVSLELRAWEEKEGVGQG